MVGYDATNVRYVREKNVAHILNEMLLHLLRTHAGDPLPELLTFLQSVEGRNRCAGRKQQPYRPPEPKAGAHTLPQQQQQRRPDVISGGVLSTGSMLNEGFCVPLPVGAGHPCPVQPHANASQGLHGGVMADGSVLHEGLVPYRPGVGLAALAGATMTTQRRVQSLLAAADVTCVPKSKLEKGGGINVLVDSATADIVSGKAMRGIKTLARAGRADPAEYNDPGIGRALLCGGLTGDGSFINEGVIGGQQVVGSALEHLLATAGAGEWRVALLGQGSGTALGYAPYNPQHPLWSTNFGGVLPGGSFLNDGVVSLPAREPGAGLAALYAVSEQDSQVWSLRSGDGLACLEDAAKKVGRCGKGSTTLFRSGRVQSRSLLCALHQDSSSLRMLGHLANCFGPC
eukprot:TRINITY_DN224_c0_g2_i1.p1 TRINITY_DN224_c0_g2~~TRINITY_DN224_c0_g2_i1.p1  ORF type:complete len:400 (+),score=130.09 TRINITY_DN224_c0_g2_i1:72-1271(+)